MGQKAHEFSLRLQTRTSPAILRVAYTSAVDEETRLKESRVEVTLSDFTFFGSADLSWVQDLGAFAKAPEGVSPSRRVA